MRSWSRRPRRRLARRVGTVFALLPPDVHQHMAAQQEHVSHLPTQVGVCECAEARPGHSRRARGDGQYIAMVHIHGCLARGRACWTCEVVLLDLLVATSSFSLSEKIRMRSCVPFPFVRFKEAVQKYRQKYRRKYRFRRSRPTTSTIAGYAGDSLTADLYTLSSFLVL